MSSTDEKRVIVIPCSGIGKAFGSVSREAAYVVTEELRPALLSTAAPRAVRG
jgi:hypothetical protein